MFRPLLENDLAAMFELTRTAGLNPEHEVSAWIAQKQWSFSYARQISHLSLPNGIVAELDGELLGGVLFSFRRFRVGNHIDLAAVLGNYVVHPEFRGVLGLALNRKTIEMLTTLTVPCFILGFHHSEVAGRIWQRFGAADVSGSELTMTARLSIVEPILRRFPLPRGLVRGLENLRIGNLIASMLGRHDLRVLFPGGLSVGLELKPINFKDPSDELDQLLHRYNMSHDLGVHRDRDYLHWRYSTHPNESYDIFTVSTDQKLAGVVVMSAQNHQGGILFEAIFDPDLSQAPDVIAIAALARARDTGLMTFSAKLTSPDIKTALQRKGLRQDSKSYNQFWIYPGDDYSGRPIYSFGDFREA